MCVCAAVVLLLTVLSGEYQALPNMPENRCDSAEW